MRGDDDTDDDDDGDGDGENCPHSLDRDAHLNGIWSQKPEH